MEQPLVSVVVISYNQAQYIEQILDSLKSQTYVTWELIVADDKSSDNSVSIFKSWLLKNNIKAKEIYHETNTGLAAVLNEAIELCEGKYVKLIAADDYLHPQCLEKSVNCLETKSEKYGMVFTDTYCVDDKGNLLPDIADYNSLGGISSLEFRKKLIKANRIAALTVLMKINVVKETGKYDSKFLIEDYYRWLRINEKYFIAYLPEKLTYYRLHNQNISIVKEKLITEETIMLQMMFDKDGFAKNRINNFFQTKYFSSDLISKDLFSHYKNYKFAIKRLKFSIEFNIPIIFYKILSKFI